MKIKEINSILRETINQIVNSGWLKTHIGKVLLGANGQAHLNHFLKVNENGIDSDFGIKPLQKIATVIDHDVMVIFVPHGNNNLVEFISNTNMEFVANLERELLTYLNNNIQKNANLRTSVPKTQIDNVLDELLG